MAAAYQVTADFTDDETQEWSVLLTEDDAAGQPTDTFPWADYTFTYQVHSNGQCWWSCDYGWWDSYGGGSPDQSLSQSSGIAIDADQNLITFTLTGQVRPGSYAHGCLLTHTATGKKIQLFDGSLKITEGNFR